jgi:uncharacterized spore protein YtfJ
MTNELNELLAVTAKELEQVLNTKTIVGAPIQMDGCTIVPLISVGFGLGVGGGGGKHPKQGEGEGRGIACGGGVKPVAVIISDKNGVRVEGLHGAAASVIEKVVDTVDKSIARGRDGVTSE